MCTTIFPPINHPTVHWYSHRLILIPTDSSVHPSIHPVPFPTSHTHIACISGSQTCFIPSTVNVCGPGSAVAIATALRAGRSGDRIPVEERFSAPVQTSPGAHPASYRMGTGFFPGGKEGRSVTLTPHPLLVLWSRQGRAIPLLPLWAVRPVQSLNDCTGCTLH